MKKTYWIAFALLIAIAIPSCKSSKKVSESKSENVKTSSHTKKHNSKSLTSEEWLGTWIIETAEKKAVISDELAEITLDTKTGKVYGCDGCNVVNGQVVFNGENGIRFESLISTMKSCGSEVTDQAVQRALNDTRSYKVVEEDALSIKFCNEKGHTVMTLVKRMADCLNGSWKVTAINGKEITEENPTMVIDVPEKRLAGFAGCNRMFGQIVLNSTAYGISFSQIGTTRMACPDMNTEQEFVAALEQVKGFYLIDDTHAALYQQPDKAIILIEKAR